MTPGKSWRTETELRNYASYSDKVLGQKSELRNYASYGDKVLGQKSELRNYASYSDKVLEQKSELRNYASYDGKIISKNLIYLITPITVTIFRGKKLNYVITPGLKKNSGKNPNYAIT